MYKVAIIFLCIFFLSGCSTKKQEKTEHSYEPFTIEHSSLNDSEQKDLQVITPETSEQNNSDSSSQK